MKDCKQARPPTGKEVPGQEVGQFEGLPGMFSREKADITSTGQSKGREVGDVGSPRGRDPAALQDFADWLLLQGTGEPSQGRQRGSDTNLTHSPDCSSRCALWLGQQSQGEGDESAEQGGGHGCPYE